MGVCCRSPGECTRWVCVVGVRGSVLGGGAHGAGGKWRVLLSE